MDFDERIKVVIPMLEAKGLFGCASLIKDLKQSVDKCQNDSYNKAIDDFICRIQSNNSIADFMKDYLEEIAEQLKC